MAEETKLEVNVEFIDGEIEKLEAKRQQALQQLQQLQNQLQMVQGEHNKLVGAIEAFQVLKEKLEGKHPEILEKPPA